MKKTISVLLLLLMIINLAACTHGAEPAPTAAPEETSASINTDEPGPVLTYHDVYDPETDFDNRFGRGYPGMAEGDDAYYFHAGNYVYYSDKHSDERGVLCAKPECVHDAKEINEDCSGCFIGGSTINFYRGKIYCIGFDLRVRHALFRMDQDGANRERVFQFTSDSKYLSGSFMIHRGKLYNWSGATAVESAVPKENANFSCWDLETGEWKLIYDRTDEVSNTRISAFCFGKYVYFCDWYFYDELERGTTVIILRWDTEKEELETIYKGEGFNGGYYQIWVESEDCIFFCAYT